MTMERWWSWNADLPAQMRHLPSGFVVTPVLYAASQNRVSRLPPGEGVVFGRRPFGERDIELELSLAGTKLAWRYGIGAPSSLTIEWNAETFGEWGLRFWVLLCLQSDSGGLLQHDEASGITTGSAAPYRLVVRSAKAPLLVTFHDDLASLENELTEHGYFYLGSRGTEGRLAALRFNLEEAPEMQVELNLSGPSKPSAVATSANTEPASETQQALEAIHDVMAWNHVFDFVNRRPYTALSRFWNSHKFGGFGVWLDDILYNAWLWGHFEVERARDNLDAVFAWQTEAGNFPCLVTGNDAWLDRSQPPIASFVVWSLYARSGQREVLERYYSGLLRNYRWWWAHRRLGDTGMLAYGTSPAVGTGLYKGTKLGAKNESSMDNSPVHDLVPFDPETGLLQAADVGLNSLAALDGEILAQIAGVLGHDEEQRALLERAETHKARIRDWLWDPARQVFAGRMLSGEFVGPLAPTSFFPLAAGIGTPEQVDALVEHYLRADRKFGGAFMLPSVTRDDAAYGDNVYWR
ncbi:MAG: glycoside hydrolase family 37, partial [Pseudomonadota bacterium]